MYDKVFNLDFTRVFKTLSNSYQTNTFFLGWLFLLFIFPIWNYFTAFVVYWYKFKKKNIKVKWFEWLIFCGVNIFVRSITPFSIGGEPYAIYWMNKKGLTVKEATSIAASILVACPIAQIILTWPSFFWMCSIYWQNSSNTAWATVFWAILVGLCADLFSTAFILLTSLSKHIHYAINMVINKFRKLFRLSYKTKEQIKTEFIENKEFKRMFINELKDIKFTMIVVSCNLIWSILQYVSVFFSFELIGIDIGVDFMTMFNYVNVGVTANNFVPIPGGEGTLQGVLITLFSTVSTSPLPHEELVRVSTDSIFVWRIFTFYICAIFGIIMFITEICTSGAKYNIKTSMANNKDGYKGFTIIIPYLAEHNQSIYFLEWLIRNSYNDLDIDIIIYGASERTKEKITRAPTKKLNIIYRTYHNEGYGYILKDLKKHQLVKKQLFTILSPNSSLSFDTLYNINSYKKDYDIYSFNYLRKSEKFKIILYLRPYKNFMIKEHKYNRNKKIKHIGIQNSFIRSIFIDKINVNNIKDNIDIKELNHLILDNCKTVRTFNTNFGYSPIIEDSEAHASELFIITKIRKTMYL